MVRMSPNPDDRFASRASHLKTSTSFLTLVSYAAFIMFPALPLAVLSAGNAMAADEPRLPEATTVGPLRRDANGEIKPLAAAKDGGAIACRADTPLDVNASHGMLDSVRPGRWLAVANSRLANTIYNGSLAASLEGNTGPSAIMSAWSGGTFDAATASLIVWGGGHQDYYGNAVYAFSLKTLTWSALTKPSSIAGWNQASPVLPDGTPSAQHTYDALTMLANGQMFVAGSQAATPNGNSYAMSWLFNPTTGAWSQAAGFNGSMYDNIAVFNAATKTVFAINNITGLQAYNATTNSWAGVGGQRFADYHMTGAIDPIDGIMVAVGNGHLQAVSLTSGVVSNITSTGDQTIPKGNAPGFVWDSAANLFVGWNGGSTVYTLDPHAWQWTAYTAAPDNNVTPTAPTGNGTFGRFQYDAGDKVFIVVNDISQDVYIYKDCF
jgi:hypothetical protein